MSYISKLIASILFLGSTSLLVGCSQMDPNVALKKEYWDEKPKKSVTVALDKSVKADVHVLGSVGILDLAIIQIEINKFSTYLNQYNLTSFDVLQTEFIDNLHQHEISAEKYDENIEIRKLPNSSESNYITYERKNFKPLSTHLKNSQLLLLNINRVGAVRHYSSVVPLDIPQAICEAEGRLIDLNTNKTLWRFTTTQEVRIDGKWDQPPEYPHFTKALNKAISQANQAIINDFFSAFPDSKSRKIKE